MKQPNSLFTNRIGLSFLFLFYLVVVIVTYGQTVHAKFLFDWNTNMTHYLGEGWHGLTYCYNDRSMRWVCHIVNLIICEIVHMNPYGWFFCMSIMHALNALLLTVLVDRVALEMGIENISMASIAIGLVWLLSPYHTEAVVWGAATLHLAIVTFMLLSLLSFVKYYQTQGLKYVFWLYVFYFLAMFTFENFVPFPFILLLVFLLVSNNGKAPGLTIRRFFLLFFLPICFFTIAYFVGNKLRIGKWVGRYGEAAHLNTDIFLLVPNLTKYISKLLLVPLFFSYKVKDAWFDILNKNAVVWFSLFFYLGISVTIAYKFIVAKGKYKLVLGFFIMFLFAILPVINMYFPYNKDIEGDRYFYWASMFFYTSFVVLLSLLFRRYSFIPLLFILFVSVWFLVRNNVYWKESGKIATALMNDFRWQSAKRVFVLLTPDDYRGAYCMRSMPGSTLAEMLLIQRGIDMGDRMIEVYQYNVMSPHDSATCEVLDSVTLNLKVINHGGWLWRNSFGASDYNTSDFAAITNKWYPWFTVKFKNKKSGDVFIYPVNDHWVEVKNF